MIREIMIKKILNLLEQHDKKKLLKLSFMITFTALIEAAGIASIMPFIAIVTNPNLIEQNVYIHSLYLTLNGNDKSVFLIQMGFIVLLMVVISVLFRAATLTTTLKFVFKKEAELSHKMLQGMLRLGYLDLITFKKDEVKKVIFSDVNKVVVHVIQPILIIASNITAILIIVLMLFIIQPVITALIVLVCGLYFSLVYILFRKSLQKIGEEKFSADKGRFSVLESTLSDLKLLKLERKQSHYISQFKKYADTYANTYASGQLLAQMPRFLFELLLYVGIIGAILIVISSENIIPGDVVPYVALFAVSGYKIMPALNNIYFNISTLKYSTPSLYEYYDKYREILKLNANSPSTAHKSSETATFQHLELCNIAFNTSAMGNILKDVNLKVQRSSIICITGSSGSGKTLILDIISGLITPVRGSLHVNGKSQDFNDLENWQNQIAYVPQESIFFGGTILENIAPNNIELHKDDLQNIIATSCLTDVVTADADDIHKHIGDFGVQLSGGQKQRLAIARALAKKPSVLLLDEATSALDAQTEKDVLSNLAALTDITIIMVAHRTECKNISDHIYHLDGGRLIEDML